MNKVLTIDNLQPTCNILHKQSKKIVLVGGVFDLLHQGHKIFLKKAKQEGDVLIVLLESDENVRKYKGGSRPIHSQKERAKNLAEIPDVDYIIKLMGTATNKDYDELVLQIKPAIIATTKGDPKIIHKKRQGDILGIPLKEVEKIPGISTTQVLQDLQRKL